MFKTTALSNLLLIGFLAAILCPMARGQSLADVIEQAEKSVIRIEVQGVDGLSLGSGFVIDDKGTIITNCHVLAGARSAMAYFNDGRAAEITETLIIEAQRDIIVAKINRTDAPALPISDKLPRKGERVIALGAPKGLEFTATQGIVSAIRSAEAMESDVGRSEVLGNWIQVDTAISPGSSGGPLINSQGEVVAMSTLASQGSAQSLNFGISAIDIAAAIEFSEGAIGARLASKAINIRMSEDEGRRPPGAPGSSGGTGGGIVRQQQISESTLAAYVQAGIDQFDQLKRGIKSASRRLQDDMSEMRKGSPFIPPALYDPNRSILRVSVPGRRSPKWYFRSQSLKDATIARQRQRIREYNRLSSEIAAPDDPHSVQKLLLNYGPPLNLRDSKSIGWADDLIVAHAFNAHDVLVIRDDEPYLMWRESTTGLSAGEILSGPVYVAGTATAEIAKGITGAVTVLQSVSEERLQEMVTEIVGSRDGFRTWTSADGKSTVEAKLLDAGPTEVILKRRDGEVVKVPRSALSSADRDHLDQL